MAGYDVAMREAKKLKAHMERYGIKVSIELQQGRGEWYVAKYHVMNHHTATRKGTNPTPALYICKNGREGLPGPLCNGYGGYDFVFRIITMGLANHSGQGGPITIDGVHVPRDSGRVPFFGIEWEGGYHTWTATERKWMATCNHAITTFYKRPLTSQLEHLTWAPTRKIDRLNYTRAISITETNAVTPPSTPSTGGFLMALSDKQQQAIYDQIVGGNDPIKRHDKELTIGALGRGKVTSASGALPDDFVSLPMVLAAVERAVQAASRADDAERLVSVKDLRSELGDASKTIEENIRRIVDEAIEAKLNP